MIGSRKAIVISERKVAAAACSVKSLFLHISKRPKFAEKEKKTLRFDRSVRGGREVVPGGGEGKVAQQSLASLRPPTPCPPPRRLRHHAIVFACV